MDLIANFYELWGGAYLGNFSNQMYDNNIYFPIALYSILLAIILNVAYYYIIDRPGTARFSIWSINILVGGIISYIIAYVSANNKLTTVFANISEPLPAAFTSDILLFGLINTMWTILLMFLLSLVFKWKSTHSSFIPF